MSSTLSKIPARIRRRARKTWTETQLRSRGKLPNWRALSEAQREYVVEQVSRRSPRQRWPALTMEQASAWLAEARTLEALLPRKLDFTSDWSAATWTVTGTDQHGNFVTETVDEGATTNAAFQTVRSVTAPAPASGRAVLAPRVSYANMNRKP